MSEPSLDLAFKRFFPIIRAKCARMLEVPEDAADVAQETFVRLWRSGVSSASADQVTAWIYKTATRLVVDRLRDNRVRGYSNGAVANRELEPARNEESIDARRSLARIARRFSGKELEIAVLHRIDGLDQQEVARVLSVSERTVRRSLRRFDEALQKMEGSR